MIHQAEADWETFDHEQSVSTTLGPVPIRAGEVSYGKDGPARWEYHVIGTVAVVVERYSRPKPPYRQKRSSPTPKTLDAEGWSYLGSTVRFDYLVHSNDGGAPARLSEEASFALGTETEVVAAHPEDYQREMTEAAERVKAAWERRQGG